MRILLGLIPYPALEDFRQGPYAVPLTDRRGEPLYTVPLEEGLIRLRVNSAKLPRDVILSILASEDRWFFWHPGVNPFSVIQAAADNLAAERIVRGGSTVTMQLASLVQAAREPGSLPQKGTLAEKASEALAALRIESKLSKEEILSLYLSRIPFGRNREGYGAAAQRYCGLSLADISPAQARLLSVIPRNPEHNDPFRHPENTLAAARRLGKMTSLNDLRRALQGMIARQDLPEHPMEAPHFVQYVRGLLGEEVFLRGRPVRTTLDSEIQHYGERLIAYHVDNARESRINQGALLAVKEGEIVAWVGSRDFFDFENHGQIDGVRILRQPGSTLKPFLYELALERGFSPASVLPDIPMTFGTREVYRPENYSQTYNGPVRLRTALGSSLNIPAVYTLERLGVDAFLERLQQLGFESLAGQENVGVGLAVGNAETSLHELVRAFRGFREEGRTPPLAWRMPSSAASEGRKTTEAPAMDPLCAAVVRDILADNEARILGFGRASVLNTEFPSYFKTGTSNQFNNIWALGAASDMTCGVWMGNFSGDTVIGRPGSSLPARAAVEMLETFSAQDSLPSLPPMEQAQICALSGGRAGPHCPHRLIELFPRGNLPAVCPFHHADGVHLPEEYAAWTEIYRYDQYRITPAAPQGRIEAPLDGGIYFIAPDVPLESQGVEFRLTGTGSFRIEGEGSLFLEGELPFHQIISLERGRYSLDFYLTSSPADKPVTRYFEVR